MVPSFSSHRNPQPKQVCALLCNKQHQLSCIDHAQETLLDTWRRNKVIPPERLVSGAQFLWCTKVIAFSSESRVVIFTWKIAISTVYSSFWLTFGINLKRRSGSLEIYSRAFIPSSTIILTCASSVGNSGSSTIVQVAIWYENNIQSVHIRPLIFLWQQSTELLYVH